MLRRISILLASVLLLSLLVAGAAMGREAMSVGSAPGQQEVRPSTDSKVALDVDVSGDVSQVVQVILSFAPGAVHPMHEHGGKVLVNVIEGELTIIRAGGAEEIVYGSGETWIEEPGQQHWAENRGGVPARVAAAFVLGAGATPTTFIEAGAAAVAQEARPTTDSKVALDIDVSGDVSQVVQVILSFAPGAIHPMHEHGGKVLVNVIEGELTIIRAGGAEEIVYGPGETWIEEPGQQHWAENRGGVPARVAAAFVLGAGATPTTFIEAGAAAATVTDTVTLATAKASVELVQDGRAIVLARGNRMIVDSVPPLGGPNEEINPMDMLLGALGTCGTFIYETAAQEMDIPLDAISVGVEADFAPAGLRDGAVNPRVRAFRIGVAVDGPTMEEAEMLADQFRIRCPIYTTLELSAPLTITNRMLGEGTAVLEVDFTYSFDTADEYIAEVSPMAEKFAAVPGLIWKTWTLDEESKRAGAVYLFETPAARQAYLDSELAAAVAGHPALSDFRVQQYAVMRAESLVTRGPLEDGSDEMDDASTEDVGVVLEVAFTYNFETAAEYIAEVSPMAEQWAAVPGLLWKVWTIDAQTKRAGAVYYFESAEARQAYLDSELGAAVANHPALSEFDVTFFDVMADESIITHGPIGAP